MLRKPASADNTTNGIETNVAAMTAPAVVKVSWIPATRSSQLPTIPRRPSACSTTNAAPIAPRTMNERGSWRRIDLLRRRRPEPELPERGLALRARHVFDEARPEIGVGRAGHGGDRVRRHDVLICGDRY